MVGVGNHEQDHISGHEKDPSKQPNFRPSWFNGGSDSGGECGLPMSRRFHMPENGLGIWWYVMLFLPVQYTAIVKKTTMELDDKKAQLLLYKFTVYNSCFLVISDL